MKKTNQPASVYFNDQDEFRQWLEKNHDNESEIIAGYYKVATGKPSMTWSESVDQAICYGWIDGQKKSYDDRYWLQKFTPRGPKSIWSKINTGKAERLIASGEMHPPGLKAIEAAKSDGRWEAAYASQKNIAIPEDFQAALDQNSNARAYFFNLKSAERYSILVRIQTAGKPETRAKRIQQFVEMLERS